MAEHKCLPGVMAKCPHGDRPVCTYQDGSQCEEDNLAYLPPSVLEELQAFRSIGLTPDELFLLLDPSGQGLSPRRLYDLARAEKDGRLVVLAVNPYLKPAQTNEVFICENGGVWPIYVTGCEVGPNSEGRLAVIYETVDGDVFCDTDIGKTVFLTRQEAEESLREEEDHG